MKVLICDDQAITREGLSMLLSLDRDITVVAQACDGAEGVELAALHQPDVVLMDLKMPGMNGIEATRQIRSRFPAIRVLVLTTYDGDQWVIDAVRAGAAGYLLKDTTREELLKAVRGTFDGKSYVDPAVAGKVLGVVSGHKSEPASILTAKLSEREVEVLSLLARGFTNADIAAQLHLSEGTVRNHVSTIFAKLEVNDRTQAAVIAIRHGLG